MQIREILATLYKWRARGSPGTWHHMEYVNASRNLLNLLELKLKGEARPSVFSRD